MINQFITSMASECSAVAPEKLYRRRNTSRENKWPYPGLLLSIHTYTMAKVAIENCNVLVMRLAGLSERSAGRLTITSIEFNTKLSTTLNWVHQV